MANARRNNRLAAVSGTNGVQPERHLTRFRQKPWVSGAVAPGIDPSATGSLIPASAIPKSTADQTENQQQNNGADERVQNRRDHSDAKMDAEPRE
jgi:hypothetical protein